MTDLDQKFIKKAERWARWCGRLPGVRAIFLSGSVAEGRATENSDIDFFIIAKHGQIWTARFFVFLFLKIANQLASEKKHAFRICPNHFITDNELEIREKDAYSAKLFSHNFPLYDPDRLFLNFVEKNATWVRKFREKFPDVPPPGFGTSHKKPGLFAKLIENILAAIQIIKIRHNPDYHLPGAKIILEENELRFHPDPKNKKFKKKKK